ncbi:hypothetical protein [Glycomyces salinus]|uniref:hypothetical protein n=1 Tax=Glycomyces salinus TaxID=980294 RepID=UPI0018EAE703|nr:hypothetical protein [Glycomyces salinus]
MNGTNTSNWSDDHGSDITRYEFPENPTDGNAVNAIGTLPGSAATQASLDTGMLVELKEFTEASNCLSTRATDQAAADELDRVASNLDG